MHALGLFLLVSASDSVLHFPAQIPGVPPRYRHKFTGVISSEYPREPRGGILADEVSFFYNILFLHPPFYHSPMCGVVAS